MFFNRKEFYLYYLILKLYFLIYPSFFRVENIIYKHFCVTSSLTHSAVKLKNHQSVNNIPYVYFFPGVKISY